MVEVVPECKDTTDILKRIEVGDDMILVVVVKPLENCRDVID